ncbi:SUKH-4 family immunity protein [Streptomyces sp. NPDC095602]|uniref:SUKH-4 family immunity protein n=1 Tax=Streptomyces sp. NPDC095602 TaxID=3155819 RepID=UPI00332B8314
MIFGFTPGELDLLFGTDHVQRVPPEAAIAAGITGDTLSFLSEIGLPDNEFLTFPDFRKPGAAFKAFPLEERGAAWNLPASSAHWVLLGNFEISMVVLDARTGEVHQLAEDVMHPIRLHGDISSLVKTIAELTELAGALPEDHADDEKPLEKLQEDLDGLKSRISSQDPRPFADERSEWAEIVTSLGAGMWG